MLLNRLDGKLMCNNTSW